MEKQANQEIIDLVAKWTKPHGKQKIKNKKRTVDYFEKTDCPKPFEQGHFF